MQYLKILLVTLLLGSTASVFSQKQDLQSMIKTVKEGRDDTVKVNMLISICDSVFRVKPEESIQYGTQALELSRKLNFRKGEAYALKYIALGYYIPANYILAIEYFQQALEIFEEINDKKGTANMLGNIGVIYNNEGNDTKALDYYLRSLNISEEINDSVRAITALGNIGLIYSKKEATMDQAQDYYLRALRLADKLDYQLGIGTNTLNLGELLLKKGDYQDALKYFERSLVANTKTNATGYISSSLINIGKIYALRKDYDNAIKSQEKALNLAEQNDSKLEMGQAFLGLASTYMQQGDTQNALKYFRLAEQITGEVGAKYDRMDAVKGLAAAYASKEDYVNAYHYKNLESGLKDTLFSQTSQEMLNNLQFQYEVDSRLKENEVLKRDARLRESKSRILMLAIGLLILGIVCTSVFLIVLARAIRQKKKANAELEVKNTLITLQKQAITDSIQYAKRIQTAILPPAEVISDIVPENLIIFRPRDIVSGDFYWMTKVCERRICMVADCTGHGVPGALMSMLGVSFLNEIVSRHPGINAAEMLGDLRKYVVKSLRQNQNIGESKDGMDVALLIFNEKMTKVEYAGANNPMILVRDGEVTEYKSNKMPIGIHLNVAQPFSSQEIEIQKGDMLYIFSDGYVDQFGGPDGKKFMIKNFRNMLGEIHRQDLETQKKIIETTLTDWMGNMEQVDDILVMGIRV
jgi:serine phosphatase RsbU (regulator of sigma subunit)/tetratricopeptide (TPR) repeat protein